MILSDRQRKFSSVFSRITLVLAVATVITLRGTPPAQLGECTLALIRSEYTSDGRPILWKNRDVSNFHQVVHQGGSDGYFRYVGIGYAGDGTRVYGGVNEVGFAVANSNSYNIGNGNSSGDADDGTLQTNALRTCSSLYQFRHLLDSTNTLYGGRTQPSNLFVFDSTGAMSIFEAGSTSWVEYPVTASSQFAVRSNYSYSGSTPNNIEWGMFRHNRAQQLVGNLLQAGPVHFDSMFSVARDIAPDGWQSTQFSYAPAGDTISLALSICRYSTVSTMVIQGGKWTAQGWLPPVCWFMLGKPFTTIAVPVWPGQSAISPLLSDRTLSTSLLCERAHLLLDSALTNSMSIESSRLNRVLLPILSTERNITQATLPWLSTPINPATQAAISDTMANIAYSTLLQLQPDREIPTPAAQPSSYTLTQPTPNPFNPVTTIQYTLVHAASVKLSVFNALGERLGNYEYGTQLTGSHTLRWNGGNAASGIIWLRIQIGSQVEWRKALLLK